MQATKIKTLCPNKQSIVAAVGIGIKCDIGAAQAYRVGITNCGAHFSGGKGPSGALARAKFVFTTALTCPLLQVPVKLVNCMRLVKLVALVVSRAFRL